MHRNPFLRTDMKRIVSISLALIAAAMTSSCIIEGSYTYIYRNETQYDLWVTAIFVRGNTHFGPVAPGEALTVKELGGGPVVVNVKYGDTGVIFHYCTDKTSYRTPAKYECYEADGNTYTYTFNEESYNFAKEMNEMGKESD